MEAKVESLSKQTIKPSYPTPHHLKYYKRCFFDQLNLQTYIPIILFYPASKVTTYGTGFSSSYEKLKSSLSDVLTLYYPFCGRAKGNDSIECNDAGVLFNQARVPISLTEILENPQTNVLKQFMPIDPFEPVAEEEERVMMAVQVTELKCGAMALCFCGSHVVADGATMSSFLKAWVGIANGSGSGSGSGSGNGNPVTKPHLEASKLFPPIDFKVSFPLRSGGDKGATLVGMRLVFDEENMSRLKAKFQDFNPTGVEALTAVMWKSFMDVAKSSEQKVFESFITQVVNIRSHLEPPLPENCVGNIVLAAITPAVVAEVAELRDLALLVRNAIRHVVENYVKELVEANGGFDVLMKTAKIGMSMASKGNRWFMFTSWTKFHLHEADFGWGKPTWACTIPAPAKDFVILLPSICGKGIEALVTLTEEDAVKFECHQELLQYANVSRVS
ncbi:hypothetical protein RJT34_31650 [Clitoria ternatea]|uniref:Uncharacterized protein n=1 Tax=Clitoria ternatea TaxID=43366 RepID=A0AAN9EUL8_CLITE